jgi:hypothetical protein
MKKGFFVLLFCILVFVGTSSAQQHDWVSVETATSGLFRDELDRNFNVLPSGNVQYWIKRTMNGFDRVDLYEVDCVKKQWRQLRASKTDQDGELWTPFNQSSNGQVAAMVCRMAKLPIVGKKIVKKKVARSKSVKRRQ